MPGVCRATESERNDSVILQVAGEVVELAASAVGSVSRAAEVEYVEARLAGKVLRRGE